MADVKWITGKYKCDTCQKPTDNMHTIKLMSGDLVIHRCDKCDDKLTAEIEWQNEQWKECNIICPWCGDSFSDYEDKIQVTDNPYEDFEGTVKCPSCEKKFELEIETTCTYTTRKPSECFNYNEWLKEQEE